MTRTGDSGESLPASGCDECHDGDKHPGREIEECGPWRNDGEEKSRNNARGEIPERLDRCERSERGSTNLDFSMARDGRLLGRLGKRDPETGGSEAGRKNTDLGASDREASERCREGDRAERENENVSTPVAEVPSRDARGSRDRVVPDIEPEGDLCRPRRSVCRCEELDGAEDQQCCGNVADLERPDPEEQLAEMAFQDRSKLKPDRLPRLLRGVPR